MILIITGLAADASVLRLSKVLQSYDAEHLIVAASTMEQQAALAITGAGAGSRTILRLNGREIDLSQVRSAWLWRTWHREKYEPGLQELSRQPHEWAFFQGEWGAFCKGLCLSLAYSGAFCVNPPPFHHAFEEKCCQMLLAAQAGLDIPPTLYTASLPLARSFYDQHGGAIIYKPFKSYMRVVEENSLPVSVHKLYTNRVQAEQLAETEPYIPTPGIFQPYVEKQIELRIVVVGRNLFACAIHSQQSARSREDWRRYDLENTPYVPYELPPDVAGKILAFMERLGLVFGSIDMIVTPAGEHIFLELNPNGQFDWVAQRAGLPIYEHLAAMLCAGQPGYPAPAIGDPALLSA